MKLTPIRAAVCSIIILIAISAASAAKIELTEPMRLPDGETMKMIYFFPHWWDPWKSDDAALTADLQKMRDIGFNTVCLDHEVSQALDREWYWLDREYKLAGQEKMSVLPWLQLQCVDRVNLMNFSHLQLKAAMNQDKVVEEDCADFRDSEFRAALARYIIAYLDRYAGDPALLKIKDGDKLRPVVGLTVEVGWRSTSGLPLSFDEDTNAYFRKWMKSSYHNLSQLNSKWGTSYASFDDIDPCDKAIFNYAYEDKSEMPMAVREHVRFRARMIDEAFRDVIKQVKKHYKDVLFAVEIAYPFSSDNPDATVYRWNDANEYKAVESADIVCIRTVGNTSSGEVKKEQDIMMMNGKRVILSYRLFADSMPERAVGFALDCALCANGLGYYNWNEAADDASAIYDKPDRQALAKIMINAYDMLYDTGKRHEAVMPAEAPSEPVPASGLPEAQAELTPPSEGVAPVPVEAAPVSPIL